MPTPLRLRQARHPRLRGPVDRDHDPDLIGDPAVPRGDTADDASQAPQLHRQPPGRIPSGRPLQRLRRGRPPPLGLYRAPRRRASRALTPRRAGSHGAGRRSPCSTRASTPRTPTCEFARQGGNRPGPARGSRLPALSSTCARVAGHGPQPRAVRAARHSTTADSDELCSGRTEWAGCHRGARDGQPSSVPQALPSRPRPLAARAGVQVDQLDDDYQEQSLQPLQSEPHRSLGARRGRALQPRNAAVVVLPAPATPTTSSNWVCLSPRSLASASTFAGAAFDAALQLSATSSRPPGSLPGAPTWLGSSSRSSSLDAPSRRRSRLPESPASAMRWSAGDGRMPSTTPSASPHRGRAAPANPFFVELLPDVAAT